MMWIKGDRVLGGEGRSLFCYWEIGDRVLWVVRSDRCLILEFRRSGLWVFGGAIAVW
ncbi:MAG: hypothetical protein ACK5V6_13610 [Pseudanabaena sp.]